MMRLQPLTGAVSEPATVASPAAGPAGGFDTALAASVTRQDVPGWGGTIVPGAAMSRQTAPSSLPAANALTSGSVATVVPAAQSPSSAGGAQSSTDTGLLSPTRAIPAPLQIGASIAVGAAMGNPIGVMETVFMGMVGELARMGPDLSRPAMPAGMSQTHTKAGIQPVSPGTLGKGEYLTLATTMPAFLANGSTPQPATVSVDTGAPGIDDGSSTQPDTPMVGLMAHYAGMNAYQRRQALERGIY